MWEIDFVGSHKSDVNQWEDGDLVLLGNRIPLNK